YSRTMARTCWTLTLATAALAAAIPHATSSYAGSGASRSAAAAAVQAAGPGQVNPATIETGGRLFRERCADCHGGDAKGSRGPDLTGLWTDAAADDRAFKTIRTGIAGSI